MIINSSVAFSRKDTSHRSYRLPISQRIPGFLKTRLYFSLNNYNYFPDINSAALLKASTQPGPLHKVLGSYRGQIVNTLDQVLAVTVDRINRNYTGPKKDRAQRYRKTSHLFDEY